MKCADGCGMEVPAMTSPSGFQVVRNPKWPSKYEPYLMFDVIEEGKTRGTTVSVKTLVDKELPVPGLTEEEIRKEYAKMVRFLSPTAA